MYLCATPIGNLEDITLRVLRILGEVDLIAAEDTRRARILLGHYGIKAPLTSLHQHNEAVKGEWICRRLLEGQSVALVSDAGTPGISDPGAQLVALAIGYGIPVVALPGPSAVVAALSVSGLDTRRFVFEGFLPRQGQTRRRRLRAIAGDDRTHVFFEAPHRIAQLVDDLLGIWGDRRCALVRELTKLHEEVVRGTLSGLRQDLAAAPRRGEMVLVVEGSPGGGADQGGAVGQGAVPGDVDVARQVLMAMEGGMDKKEAVAAVAKRLGLPRREVYRAAVGIPARPGAGG